jgi:hypothetical protein
MKLGNFTHRDEDPTMSNPTANASHYGHATRRIAAAQPPSRTELERQAKFYATDATFKHLFTNPAERVSVMHKIASDWTAAHGQTTPSLDYLVERLTAQIETKRAQLLQDGDDYREPSINEIQ